MPRVGAALRRRDFVEAAVQVIAEHGAAGATTRRIAAAAGSPLASLHYVFHTKDDLFLAVYESLLSEPMARLPDELVGASVGRLVAWELRAQMEWLIAHPGYARAQAELFYWGLRNNPTMAVESYRSAIRYSRDVLRSTVSNGVGDALLEKLARLTVCLIDGLLNTWFAFDDIDRLRADLDAACEAARLFADEQLHLAVAAPQAAAARGADGEPATPPAMA